MTSTTLPSPPTLRPTPPPGPRGHWFLGMLPALQRDILGMYTEAGRTYGDAVTIPVMGLKTYVVYHPDYFKHILQDNNRNYRRNVFLNAIIKTVFGLNLFTSDGDDWLTRRRLMQPAFHRQRLASFGALMTHAAQTTLADWERRPAGQAVAVDEAMMKVTLQVAGQALFSVDLLGAANTLGEAFTLASEYVNHRLNSPLTIPTFIPTKPNRQLKRAMQAIDHTIYALIAQRRKSTQRYGDLLEMLMEARDEDTGAGMTDTEIRNEVGTLMFAGHETTAVALTWAWYLLSQNPAAETKLHAELATVLGGRAPTLADLPNLKYTRMVIDETLRLYPPAFGVTRQSLGADTFGDYTVPANASLTLLFYAAHRDPRWWANPEQFDPERFTPEQSEGRPAFAYAPFGGGPRLCIGNQFALTEAQLILATLAQRYRLRLVPGHPVRANPVFALRTSHGMPMTLEKR